MAFSLGSIGRTFSADRRSIAPSAESTNRRPGTSDGGGTNAPEERSDAVGAPQPQPVVRATPAPRPMPASGAVPVGCACCGRLATAASHLDRSAPVIASGLVDRATSNYRRHSADPDDGGASRSVVS
jgi:hypothetical protein